MTMTFTVSFLTCVATGQDYYQCIRERDTPISMTMLQSTHYMFDLKDHERNHCMRSLMDRTPPWSQDR